MTDSVTVTLPRAYVAKLCQKNGADAKYKRTCARLTESGAPKTKRNATAIANWRREADECETIAKVCAAALANETPRESINIDPIVDNNEPHDVVDCPRYPDTCTYCVGDVRTRVSDALATETEVAP